MVKSYYADSRGLYSTAYSGLFELLMHISKQLTNDPSWPTRDSMLSLFIDMLEPWMLDEDLNLFSKRLDELLEYLKRYNNTLNTVHTLFDLWEDSSSEH